MSYRGPDAATPRPDVWLAAALEWLVVSSALAWMALVGWKERTAVDGPGTESQV